MKKVLVAAALALCALPGTASAAGDAALVQLAREDRCRHAAALVRAGATSVAAELGLWRLERSAAEAVAERLRRGGATVRVQPDRRVGRLAVVQATDPLLPEQWWRGAVRADAVTPPGPGRVLTIVDSGLDLEHPEFAGRPDTVALNEQAPFGGGTHGTAVASLAAAPANGVGIVGIYPNASLAVWDAAQARDLVTSEIVAGILAAARTGPGVINLSLGGSRDSTIEQAVNVAVARGMLVVAAGGNSRDGGSPIEFPASHPHVLTVAATGRDDAPAPFSSASPYIDLAAPGVDMVAAVPRVVDARGYRVVSGTSFSAPLVSGAAALVWTLRPDLDASQVFEIVRRSARDVGTPGRDADTGFGILDLGAAVAYPPPVPDRYEPNEDVDQVRPEGFFSAGVPALTTPQRPRLRIAARLDAVEDPRDVYRVWVPARSRLDVVATADADVSVGIWRDDTATVTADARTQRLAFSGRPGATSEKAALRNTTARGTYVYVDVTLARGVAAGTYRLSLSPQQLPPPPKPARRKA